MKRCPIAPQCSGPAACASPGCRAIWAGNRRLVALAVALPVVVAALVLLAAWARGWL